MNCTPDPNSKKKNADEIINKETEIVNTEEQEQVLNDQDTGTAAQTESDNKQKGYEEGTRNDSLTEPESKDSDDQLSFPDEEGKQ